MSRVEELVRAQLEKVDRVQLNAKVSQSPLTSKFVDDYRLSSL